MTAQAHTVYVVDDNNSVCLALQRLLDANGYPALSFHSGEEFLAAHDPEVRGCLILDLTMPGLNGLQVQQRLLQAGSQRPIIFLTGNGGVEHSVKALKAGAVDFLTKPVLEERLLMDAVREANIKDDRQRAQQAVERVKTVRISKLQQRVETLTRREHEVLQHVISGKSNKAIAAELGTVEKTIKVHRGRVMRKMGTRSLVMLVRLAADAQIAPADPGSLEEEHLTPEKEHPEVEAAGVASEVEPPGAEGLAAEAEHPGAEAEHLTAEAERSEAEVERLTAAETELLVREAEAWTKGQLPESAEGGRCTPGFDAAVGLQKTIGLSSAEQSRAPLLWADSPFAPTDGTDDSVTCSD